MDIKPKVLTPDMVEAFARCLIQQVGGVTISKGDEPKKRVKKGDIVLGEMSRRFKMVYALNNQLQKILDRIDKNLERQFIGMSDEEIGAFMISRQAEITAASMLLNTVGVLHNDFLLVCYADKYEGIDLAQWKFEIRKGWVVVLVKDEEYEEANITAVLGQASSFNQARPCGEQLH